MVDIDIYRRVLLLQLADCADSAHMYIVVAATRLAMTQQTMRTGKQHGNATRFVFSTSLWPAVQSSLAKNINAFAAEILSPKAFQRAISAFGIHLRSFPLNTGSMRGIFATIFFLQCSSCTVPAMYCSVPTLSVLLASCLTCTHGLL